MRTYRVEWQMFYGSVEDFMAAFDFKEALDRVVIDVSAAHIWDISSVQALDMARMKLRRDGAQVEIVGKNTASETIVDKLAIHDKPGALDKLAIPPIVRGVLRRIFSASFMRRFRMKTSRYTEARLAVASKANACIYCGSTRREMAENAVAGRGAKAALVCRAFGVSETCYRSGPKLKDENEEIADLQVGLTDVRKTWGFGLCFLHRFNAKGHPWNHKRVYRIDCELELNLRPLMVFRQTFAGPRGIGGITPAQKLNMAA